MITPISLGTWPTPVEPAPRLAARLGLEELWFKRDDLSGLGGGGNKVRKLEYTCAEALAAGARTVVTSGAAQSNHARATAAAAARLGLRCVLVLSGSPSDRPGGNLVLDELAGAEIVWDGSVEKVAAERDAFVIPFGGSSVVSAEAYAECGRELKRQVVSFDAVVVAVGSGGTMAGLVRELGAAAVIGVDTGAMADPRTAVAAMSGAEPAELRIEGGQVGAGYRYFTPAVREAVEVTARTEGVFLDPTYTGRAMAALMAAPAGHFGQKVVFLHSGGLPALFSPPPDDAGASTSA